MFKLEHFKKCAAEITAVVMVLLLIVMLCLKVPVIEAMGYDSPAVLDNNQNTVNITIAGDLMFHITMVNKYRIKGGYDITPAFSGVRNDISSADMAFGNFETVIYPKHKLAGFPKFNSPKDIACNMKSIGYDVLSTANNHIMDNGTEGLYSTDDILKKYGIIPVGTGKPGQNKPVIYNVKGLRIGVCAYTYGTNAMRALPGTVNYINTKTLKKDVSAIRKKCDYLIVYFHIGTEYRRSAENYEKAVFRMAADGGGDIIVGSHPHVVRPSEFYTTGGRRVPLIYSLGNFISNQRDKYTDIGEMLKLKLSPIPGKDMLLELKSIPVYRQMYYNGGKIQYRLIKNEDIAKYKGTMKRSELSYVQNTMAEILKNSIQINNNYTN